MNRIAGGVLLLALALPAPLALPAQDKPKDKDDKEASPAQQYQALDKEFRDSMNAWMKIYQATKSNEEKQKLFTSYPQPDKFAPKFLALAEKHPKDPAAVDALVWVATNTHGIGANAPASKALAILERDHLQSDKLDKVCTSLSYRPGKETETFLRAVLEKSPHKNVQGVACLSLAQALKSARGQKELPKEVEALFERAEKQYGDVKLPGRAGTVGERAKTELFEVRFLAVGKTAPDIAGEDQDGVKFKLSDYRGKVVLLDFWGNW
jgi:hypothetical protein